MSIINLRTKAAFGGIMGRDGRRQYGGGSDMGSVADSDGNVGPGTGGYQGGPQGGYGDAGSNDNPSPAVREKEKAKYEKQFDGVSPTGSRPRSIFDKINTYNSNYQKKANIKLAQKRAFQKYQDIEQYVDLMDDYGLTAEEIAAEVAKNPAYGYDVSKLEKGLETLTSNKGTSIEKTRPNQYDVNSQLKGRFSLLNPVFDKVRPDTQVTALNTLQKARDYNTLAGNPNITRDMIMDLGNRGKLPEQINPPSGGGGGGGQEYLPYLPEEEVEDEYTNDFTYRFGDTQGVGDDVTKGFYAAKGGRAGKAEGGIMGTRARRAMGGIMSRVDQRQGYGFGSIVKSITKPFKSVAKAAGKVLKSDFGKMALLAAGAYYMPGYGIKATGGFGNMFAGAKSANGAGFFSKAASGLMGLKDSYSGMGKLGKMATMGGIGLGLSMIPGLNTPKVDQMPGGGGRGGGLKNSQGGEGQQAIRDEIYEAYESGDQDRIMQLQKFYGYKLPSLDAVQDMSLPSSLPYPNYAEGGRIGKAEGGLMDLGGMEKDYRAEGGFVPIGEYEKKDDVPARLSVNEFVFTADAVRGAGQGDIDKGAEIMENMMENLENGGTISKESQGKNGAQQMFKTSQRLGEVV